MEMNVIDKGGKWLVNTAVFRMVHNPEAVEGQPTSKMVVFEPGVPTKVQPDEALEKWLESQSLIVDCPDPMTSDEPIPTVVVATENTVVPTDDVTGKPDPASAPGIQGTAAEGPATPPAPARKK